MNIIKIAKCLCLGFVQAALLSNVVVAAASSSVERKCCTKRMANFEEVSPSPTKRSRDSVFVLNRESAPWDENMPKALTVSPAVVDGKAEKTEGKVEVAVEESKEPCVIGSGAGVHAAATVVPSSIQRLTLTFPSDVDEEIRQEKLALDMLIEQKNKLSAEISRKEKALFAKLQARKLSKAAQSSSSSSEDDIEALTNKMNTLALGASLSNAIFEFVSTSTKKVIAALKSTVEQSD